MFFQRFMCLKVFFVYCLVGMDSGILSVIFWIVGFDRFLKFVIVDVLFFGMISIRLLLIKLVLFFLEIVFVFISVLNLFFVVEKNKLIGVLFVICCCSEFEVLKLNFKFIFGCFFLYCFWILVSVFFKLVVVDIVKLMFLCWVVDWLVFVLFE